MMKKRQATCMSIACPELDLVLMEYDGKNTIAYAYIKTER